MKDTGQVSDILLGKSGRINQVVRWIQVNFRKLSGKTINVKKLGYSLQASLLIREELLVNFAMDVSLRKIPRQIFQLRAV